MRVMFDTGAAIHICPFWFGEQVPLSETTQKVTPTSGADNNVHGRNVMPPMIKEVVGEPRLLLHGHLLGARC